MTTITRTTTTWSVLHFRNLFDSCTVLTGLTLKLSFLLSQHCCVWFSSFHSHQKYLEALEDHQLQSPARTFCLSASIIAMIKAGIILAHGFQGFSEPIFFWTTCRTLWTQEHGEESSCSPLKIHKSRRKGAREGLRTRCVPQGHAPMT